MTTSPRRESELLLYTASDGAVKVGVLFRDESAWLAQKALAELFGVALDRPLTPRHLDSRGDLAHALLERLPTTTW